MPETLFTANRHVPYPTGKDFVDEGPAEMEAIAKALDEENAGDIDSLQAGVVAATDWSFTAKMENSATCALESTSTVGGLAWLPQSTIGLMRSSTTPITIKGLKPASLPGAGKYMCVGVEITPTTWNKEATVSIKSSSEQTNQSLAELNPPSITAGKIRIRDVVILNTAGVYSVVSQFDRRPWAKGAFFEGATGSAEINAEKELLIPNTKIRLETSGVVIITLDALIATQEGFGFECWLYVNKALVLGQKQSGVGNKNMMQWLYNIPTEGVAGSNLYELKLKMAGKAGVIETGRVSFLERIGVNANNGTS